MVAPLYDSRGAVRYFIGAQVDVSGLAKDCVGLESLRCLVDEDEGVGMSNEERNLSATAVAAANGDNTNGGADDGTERAVAAAAATSQGKGPDKKSEIRELCEMFNLQELETVRRHGGSMHRLQAEELLPAPGDLPTQQNWGKQRALIQNEAAPAVPQASGGGGGVDSIIITNAGGTPHLGGRLTGSLADVLSAGPPPPGFPPRAGRAATAGRPIAGGASCRRRCRARCTRFVLGRADGGTWCDYEPSHAYFFNGPFCKLFSCNCCILAVYVMAFLFLRLLRF